MAHVQHHPAIIGWQLDNETKHYDNIGRYMQEGFVRSLQEKYPDLRQLNHDFGRITGATALTAGRIFRRWKTPSTPASPAPSPAISVSRSPSIWRQAAIVREYAQPHQFVTHNFDFEWRGYSYGVQPRVDHFAAAQALDIAGVDIYHPSQAHLTGRKSPLAAPSPARLPGQNYFVLETRLRASPSGPLPGPATPAGIQPYRLRRRHGLLLALAFDS